MGVETLHINPADGTIRTAGQETGPRRVYSIRGDGLGGKSLVVYEEGSHYWAGIGRPQNYAAAEWRVYTVTDIEPINEPHVTITIRAVLIATIPARTSKEGRVEAALEAISRLTREEVSA